MRRQLCIIRLKVTKKNQKNRTCGTIFNDYCLFITKKGIEMTPKMLLHIYMAIRLESDTLRL